MPTTWIDRAAAFFAELEQDNTRQWWQRHRQRYDDEIRPAFVRLVGAATAFGPWRTYRAVNDTRFGTSKGAYKTFVGAVAERPDGVGAFVQVSSRGLLVGTGMPMPAPDQLAALRTAIADAGAGPAFAAALAAVEERGGRVHGGRWEPLRRVPRGFAADHPRAEHLRWKGVEVNARVPSPAWVGGSDEGAALDHLLATGEPLHAWLGTNVGPSALTPEERFAPRSAGAGRGRGAAAGGTLPG